MGPDGMSCFRAAELFLNLGVGSNSGTILARCKEHPERMSHPTCQSGVGGSAPRASRIHGSAKSTANSIASIRRSATRFVLCMRTARSMHVGAFVRGGQSPYPAHPLVAWSTPAPPQSIARFGSFQREYVPAYMERPLPSPNNIACEELRSRWFACEPDPPHDYFGASGVCGGATMMGMARESE